MSQPIKLNWNLITERILGEKPVLESDIFNVKTAFCMKSYGATDDRIVEATGIMLDNDNTKLHVTDFITD